MAMSFEEVRDRLLAWEAERASAGKRAPSSKQRPDKISLERVEAETGVPRNRYSRSHQPLRKLLNTIIARLGGLEVEWEPERYAGEHVHLFLLKSLMSDRYAAECQERGEYFEPVRQVIDRMTGILIKRAGDDSCLARGALISMRESIEYGEIRNGDAFMPYIETALALVEEEERRTALPEALPERLCLCLGRAGLSRGQAAQRIGVNQGTFNSWCAGTKSPDKSFYPSLQKLEALLELDPGTFIHAIRPGRMTAGRFRAALFPPELQGSEHAPLRSEIGRRMAPDFFEQPLDEQMRRIAQAAETIAKETEEKRGWFDVRQDSYKLGQFGSSLQSEWGAIVSFKTGQSHLKGPAGEMIFAQSNWRTEDTIETNHAQIAAVAGYLVDHAPEALRVERDSVSIIDLLNPEVLLGFLKFKAERQIRARGAPCITETDIDKCSNFASHLSIVDGAIRHDRRYLPKVLALRERYRLPLPDPDLDEQARERLDIRDFNEICDRLFDDIKRVERAFRGKKSNSKEHHDHMEFLLSLTRPLEAVYERLDQFTAEMNAMNKQTHGYWRAVRACALLHLLAQAPLRPATIVQLDYRTDNNGHLRRRGGGWVLVIPVKLLKNGLTAGRFKDGADAIIELEDTHGAYAALELYVAEARRHLLKGSRSDALFVATPRNPRYNEPRLANVFRALSTKLFGPGAGPEFGLEGFRAFSAHGMRDVVATAVLKKTGSFDLAGDAILDAAETVRHVYGRWRPKDRARDLKAAMRAARGERPDKQGKGRGPTR